MRLSHAQYANTLRDLLGVEDTPENGFAPDALNGFGFIVSGQPCKASWGGYYGLDDPTMNQRIAKLKQTGGTGIVSFGGAACAIAVRISPMYHSRSAR